MTPSEKLAKYAKDVENVIKKDSSKFDFLLEEIPQQIKTRTRLGKGLLGALKPLSESYIKQRERMKKKGDLYSDTKVKGTNLTQTGEMLDSIQGRREGTKLIFTFKTLTADRKAYWSDFTGRPFFDLLPTEAKRFERKIANILKESIRKIFKS